MIRPHVTLRTRGGKASDADRTRVTSVTDGTSPNCAVGVRFPDTVALIASAGFGGGSFQFCQGIRRATGAAWLIGFRKIHLLGCESFFAVNRSPGGRRVATVKELLINGLVATAAVSSRQLSGDDESVMILLLLALGRLVAFEAVDTLPRVHAHFILMHHRILGPDVTLRTFPGGPDQVGGRLLCLYLRTGAINQERSQNQSECNNNGDEDRAKRHAKPPLQDSPQPRTSLDVILGQLK